MTDPNSSSRGPLRTAAEWTQYLLDWGCAPNRAVSLIFDDGTGATGTPSELGNYLERRYNVLEDSFEIEFLDPEDTAEYQELYPPTEEREVYDPRRRDPRF